MSKEVPPKPAFSRTGARYRRISLEIWNDKKVTALSMNAQFLFLRLLTHQNLTQIGAMRFTTAGIAEEIGFSRTKLKKHLDELAASGMVDFDSRDHLLTFPNFVKHNLPANPNVIASWATCVRELPECDLRIKALRRAQKFIFLGCGESCQRMFMQEFGSVLSEPEQPQATHREAEIEDVVALVEVKNGTELTKWEE